MAQVDFSAAYRDSTRGSTLKALAERKKAAAEAQLSAMAPRQISSPWQGAAQITETIGAGIREGRIAAEENAGRQRLAELLTGGLTADEMGEATILDPELAMKHQERAWTREDTEETRRIEEQRLLREHGWDVDAATQRAREASELSKQGAEQQLAQQNDQQSADILKQQEKVRTDAEVAKQTAKTEQERIQIQEDLDRETARLQEQLDRRTAELQSGLDIEKEKATQETFSAVPPEVAAARGGDIAKNPSAYQYNTQTQEITPVEKAMKPGDIKTAGEFEKSLIETRSTLVNLKKALELAPTMFEGSGVMGALGARQRADIILKTPGAYDPELVKQATATQAYFNIMSEQAIKAMGGTLAGATTEYEMQRFLEIMANEATPLATKQDELQRMMEKVRAYEKTQMGQVESTGGNPAAGAVAPAETAPPPATTPAETPEERKKRFGLR